MEPELDTILAELKSGLAELYGQRLRAVLLYGSHARGDADEDSDIDVMVVLEGPVNAGKEIDRTGDVVAGLCLRHTTLLACVFVSESDYRAGRSGLITNVLREGVSI